jgi:kynureninase
MAVGCTYKYLNGGPGSPAFLYVRKDLQETMQSFIRGWFGARNPFNFELDYRPAEGIQKFYAGTPHILSHAALEPALEVHLEAGMKRIRNKSIRQTEYLLYLTKEWLVPLGFRIGSPINPEQRGSHVSLKHPEGYRICQALIGGSKSGVRVIPDFRTPDNIRLGIAPLYTSFGDIYLAMDRMRRIVETREYEAYSKEAGGVT